MKDMINFWVQYLIAGRWSTASGGHISFKPQPSRETPNLHISVIALPQIRFLSQREAQRSFGVAGCRQAISCQKESLVRWASTLWGWSCDPHGSKSCSFVHKRDADDHNGDADLPPGQMLSRTVSAQPHRSMWSQRGGTDGEVAFWWFHAFLHKMTNVSNSVEPTVQHLSPAFVMLICSYLRVCVVVRHRQRPTIKVTSTLASWRP